MLVVKRLNPRFDGAFLILKYGVNSQGVECLNPRFDGAFLIRYDDGHSESHSAS